MLEPKYFLENRYSFIVDAMPVLRPNDVEVDSPETAFQKSVQDELAAANRLLMAGKFRPALEKYLALRESILQVLFPKIVALPGSIRDWSPFSPAKISPLLVAKSAEMLRKTPVPRTNIPNTLRNAAVGIPADVAGAVASFEGVGFSDRESAISGVLADVGAQIFQKNYAKAAESLQNALGNTDNPELVGALQHDIAILTERSGKRDEALKWMQKSTQTFQSIPESQAAALDQLSAMFIRADNVAQATEITKQADTIRKNFNIFDFNAAGFETRFQTAGNLTAGAGGLSSAGNFGNVTANAGTVFIHSANVGDVLASGATIHSSGHIGGVFTHRDAREATAAGDTSVQLLSGAAFANRLTDKNLVLLDAKNQPVKVALDQSATANLLAFFTGTIKKTKDPTLISNYLGSGHATTTAYLSQVYGSVIPIAVGDCYAGLGSYADAEKEYLLAVGYPFLNEPLESVNLWLRMADLYNDWGDSLFRQARNTVAEYAQAKAKYEQILRTNRKLNNNSNLYAAPAFANLKTRAAAAVTALFANPPAATTENPRILTALLRANFRLTQIANGLNYLGLSNYVPPFSFEYLQNTARYFAQHASQMERSYIQFKQSAENETLHETQLEQQVEVANATVELENRNLREAREGKDVSAANLNYANVQNSNAQQAAAGFAAVRWQLQELDALMAWGGSVSDDEVTVNITNQNYFNIGEKPRSHALYELAADRTRITHDLEADRLQREINSSAAYQQVAQQQVQQAQARIEVAQQRVRIAALQEQQARENLAFLQNREFSAGMWYNLAAEARRITRRYLDMAIEIAALMEKAYEAETGRDLGLIKFEYSPEELGGLLGADRLLEDIDFFSLDFLRTKSKRAPMKQTLSLADLFPMAFDRLLNTGTTFFETTLDHFDRRYPGFYLQKVKQVELMLVGLGGSEGVHGTLRNIGLSKFRREDGSIVNQIYPADVMPLSEYNVRQDALVFQLESKDLRLFENNGIATMWQLDLPRSTNTFDLRQILDIQLVIYYDGFFDPGLETQIKAALPKSGKTSRGISLRLYAPDELFFLRSQGTAVLNLSEDFFPANQVNRKLTQYFIRATGDAAAVKNLKLNVQLINLNKSKTLTLNATGENDGSSFADPVGKPLLDTWTFSILAADNPQLVKDGVLDLSGIQDLSMFTEFTFDFK